eukprot:1180951-Pyramimonas_sp.AAC.1
MSGWSRPLIAQLSSEVDPPQLGPACWPESPSPCRAPRRCRACPGSPSSAPRGGCPRQGRRSAGRASGHLR